MKNKTYITLENYPYEGCEYANFIVSLKLLFEDDGIKKHHISSVFDCEKENLKNILEWHDGSLKSLIDDIDFIKN